MANEKYDLPVDEMARRYQAGETLHSIGASHGVDYAVVRRRLRKAGIPLRGRGSMTEEGRRSISKHRTKHLDEALLRELAGQRLNVQEIADRMPGQPSEECVRERMVKLGLARLPGKARPERNVFWRGGLTVDRHGYILVKANAHPDANRSGYVREHRLVMERELGRRLLRQEVVDHLNGDTSDNRPENLRLFATNGIHLSVTRTGQPRLAPAEREKLRLQAVQRARQRVAARLAESGSGAGQ